MFSIIINILGMRKIHTYFLTLLIAILTLGPTEGYSQCPPINQVGNQTGCSVPATLTLTATTQGSQYIGVGVRHKWYTSSSGSGFVQDVASTDFFNIRTESSYTASFSSQTSYWVAAYKSGCSESSRVKVTASIATPPTISPSATPLGVCSTSSFTLTASSSSSYDWRYSTTTTMGSTTIFTGQVYSPTQTGYYWVRANNGSCGIQTSAFIYVSFVQALTPGVTISGGGSTYCPGDLVTLTAQPSGTSATPSYVWKDGPTTISTSSTANVTVNQTKTIDLTMTSNDNCVTTTTATASKTVNMYPYPTQGTLQGTGAYCPEDGGAVMVVQSSQNSYKYFLYRSSTLIQTITGNGGFVSFAPQATTGTYTLQASNANCTSDKINMPGSVTVSVISSTTAGITTGGVNPTSVCQLTGITLTAGASRTISRVIWKKNGQAQVTQNTGPFVYTPTAIGTFTYLADMLVDNGCGDDVVRTPSVPVTIIAALTPGVTISGGGSTYCPGSSVTLTAVPTGTSAAPSYVWKEGTTTISTTSSVNITVNQTKTIDLTITSNDNCITTSTATASRTVNMHPYPTQGTLQGTGAYCEGSGGAVMVVQSSQNGYKYYLYRSTTLIQTVTGNGGTVSFSPQATAGTYTLQASNANCTSDKISRPGSVTVSAISQTIASINTGGVNPTSVCDLTGITLTAEADRSITRVIWKKNGEAQVTQNTGPFVYTPTAIGTFTYLADMLVDNGCGTDVVRTPSVPVTINQAMTPGVSISGGGSTYCPGEVVTLTATLSGTIATPSYVWKDGPTTISTTPTADVMVDQTKTIDLTITSNDNCVTTTTANASKTVNMHPYPTQGDLWGSGLYCEGTGGAVMVVQSAQIGYNYYLYRGEALVESALAIDSTPVFFSPQIIADTYFLKGSNSSCPSDTISMPGSVTVSQIAATDVLITPSAVPTAVCETSGFFLTASASRTINSIQWKKDSVNITNPNPVDQLVYFPTGTGTATYSVEMDVDNGCGASIIKIASIPVTIVPELNPSVTISANIPGPYCPGASVTLTANPLNTVNAPSYEWKINTLVISTSDSLIYTVDGDVTIDLIMTSGDNCVSTPTAPAAIFIDQHDPPTSGTLNGTGLYCEGDLGAVMVVQSAQLGYNYYLYRSGALVESVLDIDSTPVFFSPQIIADTYSLKGSNSSCPSDTISMPGSVTVSQITATTATITPSAVPTAVCETSGFFLTASASRTINSVQWKKDSVNITNPNPVDQLVYFPTGTGTATYSVEMDVDNGCGASIIKTPSIPVTIVPELDPSVTISANIPGPYCPGASVTLTANPLNTVNAPAYEWKIDTQPISNAGSFNYIVDGDVTIDLIMTSSDNCVSTPTATESIFIDQHDFPTNGTLQGTGVFCSGDLGAGIIVENAVSGVTYFLYRDVVTEVDVRNGDNNVSGILDFMDQSIEGTYSLKAENTSCPGNKVDLPGEVVVVAQLPPTWVSLTPSTLPPPASVCSVSGYNLAAASSRTIYSIQWHQGVSNITNPNTDQNVFFPIQEGQFSYSATLEVDNGCGQHIFLTTTSITVDVIDVQAPTITSGTDCLLSNITLSATGQYETRWFSSSVDANANTNYFHVGPTLDSIYQTAGVYTFWVIDYNAVVDCFSQPLTVTATVISPPTPTTASNDEIFENQVASLTISGGGPNYKWYDSPAKTTLVFTGSNYQNTFTTSQDFYVYSFDDTYLCESEDYLMVSVTVYSLPVISSTSGNSINIGETITLSTGAYDTYQWYKNLILQAGETSNSLLINSPGDYKVAVTKGSASTSTNIIIARSIDLQTTCVNFIISTDLRTEITDGDDIETLAINQRTVNVQYFDGLGRPIQGVSIQGSPQMMDLVGPIKYDQFGRQDTVFLPYMAGDNSGIYRIDAITGLKEQSLFYQDATNYVVDDNFPFAVTKIEASPLSRVLEQGAPGQPWQLGGSTVQLSYQTNISNEVKVFSLDLNGLPINDNIDQTVNFYNISNALEFDGVDDYVALNMSFDLAESIPLLTVEAWVNTSVSGAGLEDNWSIIDFDEGQYFNLFISGNDGKVGFHTATPPNNGNKVDKDKAYSSTSVNDGQWHHIAIVYDGLDKMIYVDGQLDATVTNPHNGKALGYTGGMRYGFLGDGSLATVWDGSRTGNFYQGKTGELRFWSVVRTAQEIAEMTNKQLDGTETGLLAHYRMDSGSGTQLVDLTGNGFDGTLLQVDPTGVWGNDAPVVGKYYPAGELVKNITFDEHGSQVQEFVNKLGQVILKKVEGDTGWLETYYIYDDFGNLRWVLPPEAMAAYDNEFTLDPVVFLDKWAFSYLYDDRNRMVEKKVPGAEKVYLIYDARDRLVLAQDGKQRQNTLWSFTKYDVLNRPILTGEVQITGDRATVLGLLDTYYLDVDTDPLKEWSEVRGIDIHQYTNKSYPVLSSDLDCYTVTYYDEHTFTFAVANPFDATNGYNNATFGREKGQVTGTKTRILGSANYLNSVTYYDHKYRVVQAIADNNLGGKDVFSLDYDFIGKVMEDKLIHTKSGEPEIKVTKSYTYDHVDRLLTISHQIGDNVLDNKIIVSNSYNEIGELITKQLNANDPQNVDYAYNIRGWLTNINDTQLTDPTDLFGMELFYNDPVTGFTTTAQFNGNISAIKWNTKNYNEKAKEQIFGYGYDTLNRITAANYAKDYNGSWSGDLDFYSVNNISYDLNGNILALQRNADIFGLENIDDLAYTYDGNRLTKVDDNSTSTLKSEGFNDGSNTANEYTYDSNGNMDSDANKGIIDIQYNYLNLPEVVDFGAGNKIEYIYDAAGIKLRQVVYEGGGIKTTDYSGEFIYEDLNDGNGKVLQFIQHEEGRIVRHPELVSGSYYEYQYHIKDHLGNVRMTFSENESTTSTDYLATMEDEPLAIKDLEEMLFNNLSDANRYPDNALWDHTFDGTAAGNSIQLKAIDQFIIGPAKSFYVTANDTVFMEVYAKYEDNSDNGNQNTQVVGNILDNITAAFGISSSSTGEALDAYNEFNELFGTGPKWGTVDGVDDLYPRAYLNYLFFDENHTYISGGFTQVTGGFEDGTPGGADGDAHQLVELNTGQFGQDGYLYVYLSMEQLKKDFDVYFDDFKITHKKTNRVVQSDDYYPFGLTMNSYQRTGSRVNRFLFNGIERQQDLDLGWDIATFRSYDPSIGRWMQIDPKSSERESPYVGFANNPVFYVDPLGDTIQVKYGGFLGIGRKTVNVDESGNISNTDGSKFEDKVRGFLKKTVGAIGELSEGSENAKGMLSELSNSENVFTIVNGNGSNKFKENSTNSAYAHFGKSLIGGEDNTGNGGSGGTIFWSPGSGKVLLQDGSLSKNSTLNLAHELLGHGLDANRGEMNSGKTQRLSNNEWQASYVENIIRGDMGLQYRTYYKRTNTGVGLAPRLLNSSGNPIQPQGFSPINKSWYKAYLRR